jgi:hypothetical protein
MSIFLSHFALQRDCAKETHVRSKSQRELESKSNPASRRFPLFTIERLESQSKDWQTASLSMTCSTMLTGESLSMSTWCCHQFWALFFSCQDQSAAVVSNSSTSSPHQKIVLSPVLPINLHTHASCIRDHLQPHPSATTSLFRHSSKNSSSAKQPGVIFIPARTTPSCTSLQTQWTLSTNC